MTNDTSTDGAEQMLRRQYDVTKAMLHLLDSDEFRETYGDPPGNLRAHLIRAGGELRDEIGKENLPLHINHDAPDEILSGERSVVTESEQ